MPERPPDRRELVAVGRAMLLSIPTIAAFKSSLAPWDPYKLRPISPRDLLSAGRFARALLRSQVENANLTRRFRRRPRGVVFGATGLAFPRLDTRIVTLSVICWPNPVFLASSKMACFSLARRFLARASPSLILTSVGPTLSVWPSRQTVRIPRLGSVTHELTMILASSLIRGPCVAGTADDRNLKSSNGLPGVMQPLTGFLSTGGASSVLGAGRGRPLSNSPKPLSNDSPS